MGRKMRQALVNVGYVVDEDETLEEQVKQCFLDMVDGGIYMNLDRTEALEEIEDGEITIQHMCNALMRM